MPYRPRVAMPADAPGFDTLSYARRLEDAGVDEKQAEAHAEAVRDAMTRGAAAKADMVHLENKIDKGLGALETRIAELKVTLSLAIVGVGGVIVAAIALLP